MVRFKDLKTGGKITRIGAVIGSIMTIFTFMGVLYNYYSSYREEVEKKEKKELISLIKNVHAESDSELLEQSIKEHDITKNLLDSLSSIVAEMKEGSEYFAVGFRGDGTGNLWYRDSYGDIYRVFYSNDYGLYYYVNNDGKAVYLDK